MGEAEYVTVLQLASRRLGRTATTGADFEEAGLPIMGGCEVCGASIAAYNAHPSTTGYLRCGDCITGKGWTNVETALKVLFLDGEKEDDKAFVYVVVIHRHGTLTDVEVLDEQPSFWPGDVKDTDELGYTHRVFKAGINGGDSTELPREQWIRQVD